MKYNGTSVILEDIRCLYLTELTNDFFLWSTCVAVEETVSYAVFLLVDFAFFPTCYVGALESGNCVLCVFPSI